MAQQVPLVPSVPDYRVGTTLGDTNVVLDVRWNTRDEAWYVDVLTEEGDPIAYGLKLVLGALIGGRVVSNLFPKGYIIVTDLTGRGRDAGLDDMGDRIQAVFFAPDELA